MCTVVVDKRETGDGVRADEGVTVVGELVKAPSKKASQSNSEETRVANNEASPSRQPANGHISDGDANNANHAEVAIEQVDILNQANNGQDGGQDGVVVEVHKVIDTMRGIIDRVSNLDADGWFQQPVTEKDAPNYFAVIKNPMCFDTMRTKIHNLQYASWQEIVRDFELIFNNAMLYNQKRSRVHKQALVILRAGMKQLLDCEIDGRRALEELQRIRKTHENLEQLCGIEPPKMDATRPEDDDLIRSGGQHLAQLKTRVSPDSADDAQPCESGYSSYDDGDGDEVGGRRILDESPVETVVLEPRIAASRLTGMPPPANRTPLSLGSSNPAEVEAQRRLLWRAQWLRLRVRELERQKAGYQSQLEELRSGTGEQKMSKKLARKDIPGLEADNFAKNIAFFRGFAPRENPQDQSEDVVIDDHVGNEPARKETSGSGKPHPSNTCPSSSMVLSEHYPAVCHAALTILEAKLRDTRDAVMAMRPPAVAAALRTNSRGRGRAVRGGRGSRRTLSRASSLSFPFNADETSALRQMSVRKRKQSREAFGLHDMVVPSGAMGSPKFVERIQVKMIETPPVRVLAEEELRKRQQVIAAYQKGITEPQSKSNSGTNSKNGARNARVNRKAEREEAAARLEAAERAAATIAKELLGDEGSSEEDISDEAYEARHKKQEEDERVRYNAFLETMTSANGGRKTVGDGRGRSMMGMQTTDNMPKEKPSTSRKRSASRTSSDLSGANIKTPAAGLRKTRR